MPGRYLAAGVVARSTLPGMKTRSRQPTPIDEVAESYTAAYYALDPVAATFDGVAGHDDCWTDYSVDGARSRADLARTTLARLATLQPADPIDEVSLAAMRERLGLEVEIDDADLSSGRVRMIDSPAQAVREVFDLAPTDTSDDWANIAARLTSVPDVLAGHLEAVRAAIRRGQGPAPRQLEAIAVATARYATPAEGFFAAFVASARPDGRAPSAALAAALAAGAQRAAEAYRDFAAACAHELLPAAVAPDACGRDAYALWSREFIGARIDLEETYEWGLGELARIEAEMRATAETIRPGASIAEGWSCSTPIRLAGWRARRLWLRGCNAPPTRRSKPLRASTSTSLNRSAVSNAASRPPRRGVSTTRAPATI